MSVAINAPLASCGRPFMGLLRPSWLQGAVKGTVGFSDMIVKGLAHSQLHAIFKMEEDPLAREPLFSGEDRVAVWAKTIAELGLLLICLFSRISSSAG